MRHVEKHYIRTSTSTSTRTWAHTESWLSRSLLTSPSSRLPLLQRVSNSLTALLLSVKVRDNLEPQLETAVHCLPYVTVAFKSVGIMSIYSHLNFYQRGTNRMMHAGVRWNPDFLI